MNFKMPQFFFVMLSIIVYLIVTSFCLKQTRFSDTVYNGFTDITDSSFIPNTNNGWGAYSVYFNKQNDSTEMEVILFRNVPAGNNWYQPNEIGILSENYRPTQIQEIQFTEPNRKWALLIKGDGKALLHLQDGTEPSGTSIVLPIKLKYKNK